MIATLEKEKKLNVVLFFFLKNCFIMSDNYIDNNYPAAKTNPDKTENA
jgi:hypothetical protein